jgi:hypothetical protein
MRPYCQQERAGIITLGLSRWDYPGGIIRNKSKLLEMLAIGLGLAP